MAISDVLHTQGFLFPRDARAETMLRDGNLDERGRLEVVDVSPMLQLLIRGPHIRNALRESGTATWPKGELSANLLILFLGSPKAMRSEGVFFKDQIDVVNRIVSLMERSVIAGRSVWLNF